MWNVKVVASIVAGLGETVFLCDMEGPKARLYDATGMETESVDLALDNDTTSGDFGKYVGTVFASDKPAKTVAECQFVGPVMKSSPCLC